VKSQEPKPTTVIPERVPTKEEDARPVSDELDFSDLVASVCAESLPPPPVEEDEPVVEESEVESEEESEVLDQEFDLESIDLSAL
jgi:hypothetical protein